MYSLDILSACYGTMEVTTQIRELYNQFHSLPWYPYMFKFTPTNVLFGGIDPCPNYVKACVVVYRVCFHSQYSSPRVYRGLEEEEAVLHFDGTGFRPCSQGFPANNRFIVDATWYTKDVTDRVRAHSNATDGGATINVDVPQLGYDPAYMTLKQFMVTYAFLQPNGETAYCCKIAKDRDYMSIPRGPRPNFQNAPYRSSPPEVATREVNDGARRRQRVYSLDVISACYGTMNVTRRLRELYNNSIPWASDPYLFRFRPTNALFGGYNPMPNCRKCCVVVYTVHFHAQGDSDAQYSYPRVYRGFEDDPAELYFGGNGFRPFTQGFPTSTRYIVDASWYYKDVTDRVLQLSNSARGTLHIHVDEGHIGPDPMFGTQKQFMVTYAYVKPDGLTVYCSKIATDFDYVSIALGPPPTPQDEGVMRRHIRQGITEIRALYNQFPPSSSITYRSNPLPSGVYYGGDDPHDPYAIFGDTEPHDPYRENSMNSVRGNASEPIYRNEEPAQGVVVGNPHVTVREGGAVAPGKSQWVMGYSIKLLNRNGTAVPLIAIFRHFQVDLAQDSMGAAPDSEYKSGKFTITFFTDGMKVLVEFSPIEKDSNLEDRIDILVSPLVSREQDVVENRRRRQVDVAQMVMDKFVSLAETRSPGIEFLRSVIKPWSTALILQMEQRNVSLSVADVKARFSAGGPQATINWTVNGELVMATDLLSGVELLSYETDALVL